ncbi:MAG TPA: hypothetical protein P5532_05295 [Planctomycetota bacterium]|nr:hypothetical protein [Planctomycetota bacterium]
MASKMGTEEMLLSEMTAAAGIDKMLASENDAQERSRLKDLRETHLARAEALADPISVLKQAELAFFHQRLDDVVHLLQLYVDEPLLCAPATALGVCAFAGLGRDEEAIGLVKRMLTSAMGGCSSRAAKVALSAACSSARRIEDYESLEWCYRAILAKIPWSEEAAQAAAELEILYRLPRSRK